ncbi:DUF5134 domain-containing protein [Leucobacter soli]|uniref:DUF5134 domain-containing protein n=1 Tax=Leucobacter soli TaxID=2812850 RepID=A0A916NI68_9MICO|nr:DUF5134 domain-containing protein [Leucobacter soli]CAG7618973.1 hypothetical protein LEUCIP111803_02250 [Leucobacter soli]
MLASPWDWILTVLFASTGVYCLWHLSASWDRSAVGPNRAVDVLHAVMSVSMIVMIWVPTGSVGTWVQIVAFGVMGIVIAGYASAKAIPSGARVDLGIHVLLTGAMVWMLAAMPLMMSGVPVSGTGGSHDGHGSSSAPDAVTVSAETPAWVLLVTWALVVLCVIAMGWWAYRFSRERTHRSHVMCHIGMALGMGVMLALMIS